MNLHIILYLFTNERLCILAESKETQTDLNLSRNSPRKKLLRRRNVMLQSKIYRLEKKKDTDRNKIQTQESIEHYFNLTDHFLPAPLAEFIKTQVRLNQQSKKGRKYTVKFKEFCLSIYFTSAKCCDLLSETFYLPNESYNA